MSEIKQTHLKNIHTSIAILVVVTMAILLFQAEDRLQICLLLFTISLAVIRPLTFRQWTVIDISLSLITAYDMISCLYADLSIPAIYSAFFSIFCLTAYFVLRKLFNSERARQAILQGSYLPIGAALLLAICSFFIFRKSVLSVDFQDTYHFRFLFRPLGYITNVWAEVLLILLGWVCLMRRYYGLFIFLIIVAILFSFSRGAYISLGIFIACLVRRHSGLLVFMTFATILYSNFWGTYIALGIFITGWLLLIKPKQMKLRLLVISIVSIALTGIFLPDEMKTTLIMNQTASQQQSTEGRINATQAGWETFKKHPMLGYGYGNYTFAVDQALNQNSTLPYASFAPNIPIQLLIEKGIIGSLLYLLLAIAVFRTVIKHKKRPESSIIGYTLLALTAKEMTQATLLYTPFALFMVYVLLAFLQKEEIPTEEVKRKPVASIYLLPGIVVICYVSYMFFIFQQHQNKSYQQKSVAAWEKGQFAEAVRLMEQTGEQTPNLINRGLLYMQYYRETANPKYQQTAEDVLQKARKQQPEDIQIRYLQTRLYIDNKAWGKARQIAEELATNYPKNSLYLSALSDVLYQQGEKEAALQSLVNAIRYTPRLLTGKRIRDLQQNDPVFYNILQQHLSALTPSAKDSPTDYARLGYIAQWCGKQSVAEEYLRKAVEDLPNLATPWHLLGDDNKYRLLLYGAFQKDLLSTELPEEKYMSDDLLFKMTYQPKFANWYGGELLVVSAN